MRKLAALLVAAAVCATLAAVALASGRAGWSTKLSATEEVPKQVVPNPKGTGAFTGTLSGSTLKWKLTYGKLTGPAMAAHIHKGGMGTSGPVVVPLCGPCKSGVSGSAKITPSLMSAYKKHQLYVNVHTAKNPNGEIRGQLGG